RPGPPNSLPARSGAARTGRPGRRPAPAERVAATRGADPDSRNSPPARGAAGRIPDAAARRGPPGPPRSRSCPNAPAPANARQADARGRTPCAGRRAPALGRLRPWPPAAIRPHRRGPPGVRPRMAAAPAAEGTRLLTHDGRGHPGRLPPRPGAWAPAPPSPLRAVLPRRGTRVSARRRGPVPVCASSLIRPRPAPTTPPPPAAAAGGSRTAPRPRPEGMGTGTTPDQPRWDTAASAGGRLYRPPAPVLS